nr:MAG TPA: hypothetical protein [Bacteriophage sp.]
MSASYSFISNCRVGLAIVILEPSLYIFKSLTVISSK